MKKILFYALCLASILVISACGSENTEGKSKGKTMKLAVATTEDRSLTQGIYKFGEIVEKNTDFEVSVYTDSQLGGDRELFEGLQSNSIQGSTMSTGPIEPFISQFAVFDLPFLFPDEESAYDILDGPIGKELLEELPSQGIIGLNYWENGFRQLTNNVRKVQSVEDVKSLDIRTLESQIHMDLWKTLGANPTPISYDELYISLEQGTIDGQENPPGNVTLEKFYEVQDYITKTNHVYNASPFMLSKEFWDSLSEKEQAVMEEAADEAQEFQRDLNRKESEEAYALLEEEGMTVTDLSEEAQEDFFNAVQPVYDKYRSEFGEELVSNLLDEIGQ